CLIPVGKQVRMPKTISSKYLGRGLMRRLAHHQIERSRLDLSKPAISIKRDRDRYGRIISLESHAARDEQIVKLINMKRLACRSKQQWAFRSDGAMSGT